ncbi:hypothetical protein R3P38DRAFT_2871094 [Favolaschia claudopus]|uniref:Chromate transporter n=1 Tax=Favolaschia claudopus TaxID=2862362 RepID=A0AAW0D8L3_9AGAR
MYIPGVGLTGFSTTGWLLAEYPVDDDYYTTIVRWLSQAWTAVVAFVKENFNASVKFIKENFPAVLAWLSGAFEYLSQPIKAHPHASLIISAFIFLGPQILLLPLIILHAVFILIFAAIGFGARGIVGGSPAAQYQSLYYGGNTPAGSLFAIFQSIGMKYHVVTLSHWILACIRLLAGGIFVYVAVGLIHGW